MTLALFISSADTDGMWIVFPGSPCFCPLADTRMRNMGKDLKNRKTFEDGKRPRGLATSNGLPHHSNAPLHSPRCIVVCYGTLGACQSTPGLNLAGFTAI